MSGTDKNYVRKSNIVFAFVHVQSKLQVINILLDTDGIAYTWSKFLMIQNPRAARSDEGAAKKSLRYFLRYARKGQGRRWVARVGGGRGNTHDRRAT
jgi:hypothetical protein